MRGNKFPDSANKQKSGVPANWCALWLTTVKVMSWLTLTWPLCAELRIRMLPWTAARAHAYTSRCVCARARVYFYVCAWARSNTQFASSRLLKSWAAPKSNWSRNILSYLLMYLSHGSTSRRHFSNPALAPSEAACREVWKMWGVSHLWQ